MTAPLLVLLVSGKRVRARINAIREAGLQDREIKVSAAYLDGVPWRKTWQIAPGENLGKRGRARINFEKYDLQVPVRMLLIRAGSGVACPPAFPGHGFSER